MKIVKLISLLIILSLAFSSIQAQSFRDKRKKIGGEFIFGLNGASLDFVGDNTYNKLKIGFHLGFLFDYQIMPNLFVQSGYILSKKGGVKHFKYNYTGADGVDYRRDTKLTLDANYMYIPLSIGTRFILNKDFSVSLTAGGYLAYGFKGYVKQEGNSYTGGSSTSENRNSVQIFGDNLFKRWDYGYILSGSVYMGELFFVRLSFEQGLANVANQNFLESNSYDIAKVTEIKNINSVFSLGFRF